MLELMIKIKNKRSNFLSSPAFTLAEVLVTLAIIGVIAAISVPTLLQDLDNITNKTAYKKAYADASQAFNKALLDGDIEIQTTYFDPVCGNNFKAFKSYFRITKDCTDANNTDQCWNMDEKSEQITPSGGLPTAPNGQPTLSSHSFVDASGRSWAMYYNLENKYLVDTNGFKGPNRYGKDRWIFSLMNRQNQLTENALGAPEKIGIRFDDSFTSNWVCHYPPCYFKSWLSK